MAAPQPVHPDLQLSLLHHIQDENAAYIVEPEDAERIAYYLEKASVIALEPYSTLYESLKSDICC